MAYELWENTSANLAGTYATAAAALAVIAAYADAHGAAAAATFSLAHSRRGRCKTVASGDALVKMAAAPPPAAGTPMYAADAVVTTAGPKAATTTRGASRISGRPMHRR